MPAPSGAPEPLRLQPPASLRVLELSRERQRKSGQPATTPHLTIAIGLSFVLDDVREFVLAQIAAAFVSLVARIFVVRP